MKNCVKRQAAGNPVRIGLIAAGQMGTDVVAEGLDDAGRGSGGDRRC
jgi:predicted homoserine dehydrogenase-like protein